MLWDIDLIFGIWNYNDELQIKFCICSHRIILAKLLCLDFRILHSIQIVLQNHCMPRHQTYHRCSSRGPETLLYRFEAIRNQRCLPWPLTGRNSLSFFSRTTACEDTRLADSLPSTGPQEALLLLRVFRYPTWPPRFLIGRWDILTSPPWPPTPPKKTKILLLHVISSDWSEMFLWGYWRCVNTFWSGSKSKMAVLFSD